MTTCERCPEAATHYLLRLHLDDETRRHWFCQACFLAEFREYELQGVALEVER